MTAQKIVKQGLKNILLNKEPQTQKTLIPTWKHYSSVHLRIEVF